MLQALSIGSRPFPPPHPPGLASLLKIQTGTCTKSVAPGVRGSSLRPGCSWIRSNEAQQLSGQDVCLNLLQAIPMIGSRPKGQHYLERHCPFSPLCGSILGLVSTTVRPPRDPAPPRATMQRNRAAPSVQVLMPMASKSSNQSEPVHRKPPYPNLTRCQPL